MSTNYKLFLPTHPGLAGVARIKDYHVPVEDGITGYSAAFLAGLLFNKNCFPLVGGPFPYTAAHWTATTTGTGAAVANATTAGGGLLMTCGSDSTFNTTLSSKQVVTPATGKHFSFAARIQQSHASNVGFYIGFGNAQVDPFTTDFTDFIGFRKATGAATMTASCRGNSGTRADSSSLLTVVAATEYELGFYGVLNATAGSVQGSFYVGATGGPYVETPLSSAQKTQLAAILTTPPTDFGLVLAAKGSSGNPTVTVASCLAMVGN